MLNKVNGIVIRRVDYGDSHLIVTFLAEHGRKIPVMARNAKKSKKFGYALDLFYENLFIFSQFKGMGTLSSVDTLNSHYEIRSDLFKLTYAQYIAELIDKAMEDDDESKFVYELLKFGLDHIADGADPAVIALIASLKCMPLYGYTPNFTECPVDRSAGHAQFAGYSMKLNSVLTQRAMAEDMHAVPMSNKSLYFLYLLNSLPLEQYSSVTISEELVSEMERLVFQLYDEFIGVSLKSRRILEQLK
ncbi:DNA repair protein RecO [Macrococcus equipercicus]|uniref:DNA repair protein RecO n=1 Tax=Macrococcus equipercicus TaxID=69967 RepID=A0ABQ6R9V9_9STAP|nr:DNA repair protein RecO [Macrococcus equipercicus]KAA1040075.1 DNA repair protein RecO [Macrococcus equipercicus]